MKRFFDFVSGSNSVGLDGLCKRRRQNHRQGQEPPLVQTIDLSHISDDHTLFDLMMAVNGEIGMTQTQQAVAMSMSESSTEHRSTHADDSAPVTSLSESSHVAPRTPDAIIFGQSHIKPEWAPPTPVALLCGTPSSPPPASISPFTPIGPVNASPCICDSDDDDVVAYSPTEVIEDDDDHVNPNPRSTTGTWVFTPTDELSWYDDYQMDTTQPKTPDASCG